MASDHEQQHSTIAPQQIVGIDNVDYAPSIAEPNWFGFRVSDLHFIIPVTTYCELVEKPQVNAIPNVQTWFSGLINLRGVLVPVFDLHRLLSDTPPNQRELRLLALGRGDKMASMWINGYPEILAIDGKKAVSEQVELPAILQRCASGAIKHAGKTWLRLQIDELFKSLGRHHQSQGGIA